MEEMKKDEKEYENIKYYGEFVSSYFNWLEPQEQKKEVERLENITKRKEQ